MGTIANAKVTHYYNCYNGDFIGCLRFSMLLRFSSAAFTLCSQRSCSALRSFRQMYFTLRMSLRKH